MHLPKKSFLLVPWLLQCTIISNEYVVSEGAKILVFFPANVRSHFKPFEPYFKELANRGHNLTVISAFPPKNSSMSNYHHFKIDPDYKYVCT